MNVFRRITAQTMKKNRVRTVVTIVGVVLSAAMITAVTTLISSLQQYLVDATIHSDGNWYSVIYEVPAGETAGFSARDGIKSAAVTQPLGYSPLEDSSNEYKPYLYLEALSDEAFDTLPVHLTEGRLPLDGTELLIPEHLLNDGGIQVAIGDVLTLPVGVRAIDGETLWQHNPFTFSEYEDDISTEELVVSGTRQYTVCGIYSRPGFERYSAPGYTAITRMEPIVGGEKLSVYLLMNSPGDTYDITEQLAGEEYGYEYNNELLRYLGSSRDIVFNDVVSRLAAVLIVLIMVGSISLIYNAFSISVSERSQLFGLLSSVGATRRQLGGSVLFEAFLVSAIGIPVGILSGIAGIAVTLAVIGDRFLGLFYGSAIPLHISVSPAAVISAAAIALVTVLISAYIPSRRAAKMSAIDAIRLTADIRVSPRQVRTSSLSKWLFGMEGDLARKNFKRNRRRYRSTVISLFISIVLFVSAYSFGTYLRESAGDVVQDIGYDIGLYGLTPDEAESVLAEAAETGSVSSGFYFKTLYFYDMQADSEHLDPAGSDADQSLFITVMLLSEQFFGEYAKSVGADPAAFRDAENPQFIAVNSTLLRSMESGRYERISILRGTPPFSVSADYYTDGEPAGRSFTIGHLTDDLPFGTVSDSGSLLLVAPFSYLDTLFPDDHYPSDTVTAFNSQNRSTAAYNQLETILAARGLNGQTALSNYAEMQENSRNMITIVNVFCYGFIVLISLITIANVFNTISTNLLLRRREFAVLRSVGMTDRGFRKTLNYECIFYGFKALLYGLPVAVLFTYWIYLSILQGVDVAFRLPWVAIGISIASVFLVVFVSMLYAMSKIKRDNIVDALKNENL